MNLSTARVRAALALTLGTTILSGTAYPVSTMAHAQDAQQTLTVRQLYLQVEERLAQTGKIYKTLIRRTVQGGGIRCTDITQVWVDARRELARAQTKGRVTDDQQGQTTDYAYSTVYANGTTYGTINRKAMHGITSYVSSLVATSSLPASFFQPSSIGYRGRANQIRQEMKPVPSGFSVLWLGLNFAGGRGLPAVSIQRAVAG